MKGTCLCFHSHSQVVKCLHGNSRRAAGTAAVLQSYIKSFSSPYHWASVLLWLRSWTEGHELKLHEIQRTKLKAKPSAWKLLSSDRKRSTLNIWCVNSKSKRVSSVIIHFNLTLRLGKAAEMSDHLSANYCFRFFWIKWPRKSLSLVKQTIFHSYFGVFLSLLFKVTQICFLFSNRRYVLSLMGYLEECSRYDVGILLIWDGNLYFSEFLVSTWKCFSFSRRVELDYVSCYSTFWLCLWICYCLCFVLIYFVGILILLLLLFSETGSHATKIGLNSWSSCPYLPSSRVTGMCQQIKITCRLLLIKWLKNIWILLNYWQFLFVYHQPHSWTHTL